MNGEILRSCGRRWLSQVSSLSYQKTLDRDYTNWVQPTSDAVLDLLRQTLENLNSGQRLSDKIRKGRQGSVVGPLDYLGQVGIALGMLWAHILRP